MITLLEHTTLLDDIRHTRRALEVRADNGDADAVRMLAEKTLDTMVGGFVLVDQTHILAHGDTQVGVRDAAREQGLLGDRPVAFSRLQWDGIGLYIGAATARLLEAIEGRGMDRVVWRVLDDGTLDLW